jgi:hypothetical protein
MISVISITTHENTSALMVSVDVNVEVIYVQKINVFYWNSLNFNSL